MKVSSINLVAALVVGSAVVAACGGAGDDGAGSLTPFSVTPDSLKVTVAAGCPTGDVGRLLVNGGTAPYDLFGPVGVSFQSVNPATNMPTGTRIFRLGNENTQLAVITDGTWCYEDASISVKDRHGREAVMKLTAAASGTT
jgi:hypothetical protein